jgi:hypothetical protein
MNVAGESDVGELVGRRQELERLLALLEDACAGRGRAALVLGEAGIGKTRLTEAFAAAAAQAEIRVAWGRCTDAESPAYWPWRQLLRSLHGSTSLGVTTDGTGGRDVLFATVANELEQAAAIVGAMVLVLDDIHWADPSSLALLRFVVSVLPDLPAVLVLTARDDPLELTTAAADLLRDLPPAVQRIPLGGLDSDSTYALVKSMWGIAPAAFVNQVHQRTNGNPFFVQEVTNLRLLQGERPGFAVPPGVSQVVGRRLARLSQAAYALLAVSSVIDDELDPELLALMTGRSPEEVVRLLDEGERARLLARRDEALVFAHPLIRETLYETQSHAARSELHAQVAEALAEHAARRQLPIDGLDGQLAAHWRRASGEQARRRAGEHALAAARGAVRRMGYEQAARYYRWALDAGAGDRLSTMLELGEALVLAGELTQGRALLAEVATLAQEAKRADDLARAVLAMGGGAGGFEVEVGDASQQRFLEQTLRLLPEADSALRALVLARLSVTITGAGTIARRIELARQAVSIAQRVGDVRAEVGALGAYCDAISGPRHVQDRMEAADRMLELTGMVDDRALTLLARRIRLVALFEQGQFALADADIAAYARIAEQLRLPLFLWPVPIWRGMRALMQSQLDVAWRCSEEADELGRRAQSINAEIMVLTLRAAHAVATGTTRTLLDRLDWLAGVVGASHLVDIFTAAMSAESDPERGRQLFERVRATRPGDLSEDAEWLEIVWQLSDLSIRYGDRTLAQATYDALVPYADVWAMDGIGAACFGVTAHQLGRIAAALGRGADANTWLQRALEAHRRAGASLLVANTVRALAESGVVSPPRTEPRLPDTGELRRDGRIWLLRWRGQAATVPDSKGMRDLATLLSSPGREVHVFDLVEAAGGPAARADTGNAGPQLDREARDVYRRRLAELEDDLTHAEDDGDLGQAAALREERDFIAAELAAAFGLGGRERLAGDRHERARKAVAMRIQTALRAIGEVHPALGRHLQASVATGRFCVYRPEQTVKWHV